METLNRIQSLEFSHSAADEFLNSLPEGSQNEVWELGQKLEKRELMTFLLGLKLVREMFEQGVDLDKIALAFYRVMQLGANPETGIVDAAVATFSSEFWKKALSDSASIIHLDRANEVAADAISQKLAMKDGGAILDLGGGAGNSALKVIKSCREKDIPLRLDGIEISSELAQEARKRLKQDGLKDGKDFMTHEGNMLDILRNPEILGDHKFDAAIIGYSLHHLSHNRYILEALRNDEISFCNGEYFFKPKDSEVEIPLPYFEKTLYEFVGQNFDEAFWILNWLKNKGPKPILEEKKFHNWQEEVLIRLYDRLNPGAVVCLADPDRGTSKGFNQFHLSQALKS